MAGKWLVIAGSLSAFVGVGLGAFGAHGLRDRLDERMLSAWETAVQYQLIHALALLIVAALVVRLPAVPVSVHVAGGLFLAGQILFAGSIYGLALTGMRWLGPITPLGGLALMLGWLVLVWAAVRNF
jgi:uncharacterized membrane protein YgdD (TMEM256/DUF423 family)